MPSSITHYLFNKDALKLSEELNFLKGNEDIYLFAAQGPDPFFFYGQIPSKKAKLKKKVASYGSDLHKVSPSDNFLVKFNFANTYKEKEKDILYAYIYGAGLHYLLDRVVHPYVFYRTGFDDEKSFIYHTTFETHLDVILMQEHYFKTNPKKAIKVNKEKVRLVSLLYDEVNKKNYKFDYINKDSFYYSYKEMLLVEKILFSRCGIKKALFNTFLKNSPINSMSHPKKVKDKDFVDYLNKKKDTWKNPGSGEKFNFSVLELLEITKKDVLIWKEFVKDAYNDKFAKKELEDFCNNTIYDGIKVDEEMQFQDVVYKNEVS